MTANEQTLTVAGDTIIRQIHAKQPLFLVEIEPPELHPATIISQLARFARGGKWRPEFEAAAAWAAVQLASRADPTDVEDEGGFRALFFHELGRKFSATEWEETYGFHIRNFLEVTFPSIELPGPGPWQLVGAIYRHAGIPAVLRASYALFVSNMLRGELSFSFDQYQENLHAFPSQVARQFLVSQAGYEFTRDLARQAARAYGGSSNAHALPAWSSRLVDAVVNSLRESGTSLRTLKAPTDFSKPYLCLDVETSSLRIIFDSRGVRQRYYSTDSRFVVSPFHPVKRAKPPEFRSGVTSSPEPVTPWWTPSEGGWAVFRVGDGALMASGSSQNPVSVGIGEYYLVTDNIPAVTQELVQENEIPLDVQGHDNPVWDYSIIRVSLRPGTSIPALGLRVDGAIPKPQMEWIRPGRFRTAWGTSVFVGRLPGLRLSPWDAALSTEFTVALEDADGETQIAVPNDGVVDYVPVGCPDSGCLTVRRRNLSREIVGRLTFGIIPSGCVIFLPTEVVRTDETAQIVTELPEGVSVEWSLPVSRISKTIFEAAGHERRVEGALRFESCRVPFNLRLPRAGIAIQLDGRDQHVLWTEFCGRDYALRMELPAGMAAAVFVANQETLHLLLNHPSNARACVQKVPIVHFRDAVLVCQSPIGELILRLRARDAELPDITTGCHLISAESLARNLMSLSQKSSIFEIPSLGQILLQYRQLVDQPSKDELPMPRHDVPPAISGFLRRLRSLAKTLDGVGQPKTLSTQPDYVDPLCVWLEDALACARRGLTDADTKTSPPYELIDGLPVPRWTTQIAALIEELRQNGTLPSLVGDFRLSFASGMTSDHAALCKRKGGRDLWHTINAYRRSLMERQPPSPRDLILQLRRLDAITSDLTNDSIVRSLAQAFRFMNYYRLDRLSMLDTTPFSTWPPLLGPLRTTLVALRADKAGELVEIVWPQFGVGLSEISPAVQDHELERRTGRPSVTCAQ